MSLKVTNAREILSMNIGMHRRRVHQVQCLPKSVTTCSSELVSQACSRISFYLHAGLILGQPRNLMKQKALRLRKRTYRQKVYTINRMDLGSILMTRSPKIAAPRTINQTLVCPSSSNKTKNPQLYLHIWLEAN